MKANKAKRILSLLLALVMALSLLPASALANTLEEQGKADAAQDLLRQMGLTALEDDNSEQTNSVYSIHGKSYKVLFNDYIACYVDMETGGYTILPAAEPLAENAPAGTAVFAIDGTEYVFGGDYPELNSELMPTRVRGDLAITNWVLGDFFITQYQAITQDVGHENSYAVKVAYLAEYLGDASVTPEISTRLVLPARLGEGADGVLYTETGIFLAGPTVMDNVPGEIAMSAEGEGPRTFFVLDSAEGLPHPERMALGERADLEAGQYPDGMPGVAESWDSAGSGPEAGTGSDWTPTDPATAFDFPSAVLTIPEGDSTTHTNQYGVLVNYGFYQLEEADLELTVDDELTALEEDLTSAGALALTGEGQAELPSVSFELDEALSLRDLRYQKPGESQETPLTLTDNRVSLPAGSTVSFALEPVEPECLQVDEVTLRASEDEGERTETVLTPGEGGRYSFTMPAGDGGISARYKAAPGYVLWEKNYLSPAEIDSMTVDGKPASRFALPLEKTVSVRLVADRPFFLNPEKPEEYWTPPGIYYYAIPDDPSQAADFVSIPLTNGNREQGNDGAVTFSFKVPNVSTMKGLGFAVTFDGETGYHNVTSKVIPRGAVVGGTLNINAPKINGIVRVAAQETVTIEAPVLNSAFSETDTTLAAYNLSTGHPITLTCNGATDTAFTVDYIDGQAVTFQMPDADVEVRLSGKEYHRVSAQVEYQDSQGNTLGERNGAYSTNVGVSILPESPVAGDKVTVRLEYDFKPDGNEATLYNPFCPVIDGNTSIVSDKAEASQVSISTEVTGQTYSFTMPDRDVDLKVTMRLLVNPDEAKTKNPIHTLSTRPLVEGDAIRAGIWAWEQYNNQSERPKPAQDGTSARIPAGAKVEYYAYEPDYQDDWHIEGVYLAKAETPEVPLEGYTLEPGYLNSDNTGYRTFIMPDFDCVIVVQGTEGRPIRTEAYSYLPGDDPGDASRDESLDNLVRVYGNAPAWGFSAADPTITAAKQGQSIYVDALELGGYQIESLTLLRDGREPETITPWQHREANDGPGRAADFLMGAEGVTIRAVYKADNALTFSFDESKSAGVVKLTYPEGPLKADAVYDDKGQITGYRAGSWVQMENILTDTDQYSIKSGNYNGVTVTVTPGWIMGWVGNAKGSYDLDFFWPANLGTDNPKVTIPIEKVEARYGNTYIYDAIVNHTNPEKFHTVTIDGFDLNAIDFENVYLLAYSADWTTPVAKYKVNKDAITCAEDGKTLTLNLASSNLGADDKKGAFPGFRFPTAQATNWAWGLEMTGTKLTQTSTGFEAKDAHFVERFRLYASNMNMSDAKYYLSIMRSTANEYRMYVGRTEADVQPAPGETVLFSFYNRSGFYPQEDGSVVTGPDVTQELGFNGSMTLSKSSSSGKLTVRKDDGGITMEAYNLTMKALGVPLFVPGPGNAANKTLLLRLENGTKYDLSAPADGSGTAKPLTFTSQGVPEIELLGWTGFTAGVKAITVTDRTVDVSGSLWLQWPFGDEQFGGMDLEQLRLKINDGQDVLPAFGGIHAEGAFQMPSLLVLEAGGSAIVNTFEHHYEFEAEAEVGPVSFGGRLKLIKSERFGILVPDAYEVDFNVEDVGVPLVPPTIVAYITGLTGGYENLAETMDWDPIRGKTALPDLRIIFGGHFKLLSVMSLDARFNGGAYDVEGTVSGSIEMGGHGIDFFDYFTLWLGLRNVEGVPLAGSSQARYARLRAGVTTGIGLKISTEKIQDIVKGSTAFGVYIEFNNPVSIAADSIYSFLSAMKDPSSGAPMTLQDFIKAIDLTYVSYGTGDVAVQFPKIGPFGPIRLGGVHADYDVGLKVGLNQGYQLAGAGYVRLVGTADVLGIAGYVVVDLLNSTTQVGVGAPPPFNGYRSRNLSSDGALQVLADTEADTGAAPAALMAQSESEERAAIYAGTDGNTFQYRFTVPGNGGGHLLAVRLLAEDYEPQPPMLKLYDPRGTEVTLNQWDREGQSELALPQQDAKFVVNAIYDDGMNSEDGHEGWLIAIPDQNKALVDKAEGEWTLSASREVAVQLLEQEPMPGIASATTSAATAYAGDPLPLTLSANTVTACFEHLQQNTKYAYSLDLIRRDAPAGADLETIQVRLVEDETAVGMDRYRKSLEVEADGIASVSVPLNAALLPADLARGTYYPVITLYRVDQNATETEAAMTTPLDTATAYPAVTVTNTLFDSLEVENLTVQAGADQSLDVAFDGVTAAGGYAAVQSAGWVVTGYRAALYGPGGAPVLATASGAEDEDATLKPVTARVDLTYERDGENLTLKDQDTGHTLSLTGLTPGSYTVGVTPIFAMQPTLDMETGGKEAFPKENSGVEVKAAEAPALWLEVRGGSLGRGENDTEILHAGIDFSLQVKTDKPSDITIRTLTGAEVLKNETNATGLTLTGAEYFNADYFGAADQATGKTWRQGPITLVISAVDTGSLGVSSRIITLQPDLIAPVLVLDQQQKLGAVGSAFTVTGRTRPGLTVNLLNAKENVSAVADQEGRFTLNGILPDDSGDRQMIVETTGASGMSSYVPVELEQLTQADLKALELAPAETIALTEGNTLALAVRGVKQDGSKVDLNPADLTFAVTGAHSVDAAGILTAGAGTGTVTAKLGSLTSNVLTVSGEKQVEPKPEPAPSGGGGGGTNTYQVTTAPGVNGSFEVSPKTTAKGKTVTITPKPDDGYAVNTILVTDSKGEKVPVNAQADGTYLFTMPGRDVTVTVTFKPDAWENPFTDVAESDWFYSYVAYVHQKGLFAGTSDTAFSPNVTMNRAMLWTVLARLDGQNTTGGTTWYEKGRAWAMADGISDGTDPESPVTREQVAAMLYRYAEAKGSDVSGRADLSKFGDAQSVSTWAAEALAWANAGGIVTGKPGDLLDPQGQATRAEVAAMLQRFLEGGAK